MTSNGVEGSCDDVCPIGYNGARFSPNFTMTGVPAPQPVPTLSEWAMILMSLALAGGAVLYIQRRKSIA